MREIPMLFSTTMVESIMEGLKTNTRRIMKSQPVQRAGLFNYRDKHNNWFRMTKNLLKQNLKKSKIFKVEVGDIIWVRESWACQTYFNGLREENFPIYRAGNKDRFNISWRPSIHMPKAACRIWLEVTGVRAEQLHDISESDAIAEGIKRIESPQSEGFAYYFYPCNDLRDDSYVSNSLTSFCSLWAMINGWISWNKNPWVWVISFKVLSTTGKPEFLQTKKNLQTT
jgi:hypothetical protein